MLWDKAGEMVMAEAARLAASTPASSPIQLYKNNVDNKGASYGCHENYLMSRQTPFADIVRHLTPFFVSRQVVCGAGRVGLGQDGTRHGFQVSQRADYFEVEVGLETTLKRPIINTRDEPHADPERYRRLHVIIGDANLSEVSTYLKLGTTSLVLAMVEEGFLAVDLSVERPVTSLHEVSHDTSLKHLMTLKDGRQLTAVQLQMEYAEQARKFVENRYGSDVDAATADVLERWESVLSRLETDPMSLAAELDWVAKLALLESYRERDGLEWIGTETASGGPAVLRRPPSSRAVPPAGLAGSDGATAPRRRDRPGRARAAQRYPRLLPRSLPGEIRAARGCRVVGLGDLRPAGTGRPAAGADLGATAGHESPRRRAAGPLPDRRGAGAGALRRMSRRRWTRRRCALSSRPG